MAGRWCFPAAGHRLPRRDYGNKYLRGLCQAPETQVYVSRGLGTAGGPVRFGSRPEISLLTIV